MNATHPRLAYQRVDLEDHVGRDDQYVELTSINTDNNPMDSTTSQLHTTPKKSSKKARWLSGWRTGAYISATLACCSLLINVAAVIWLSRQAAPGENLVRVFSGSCNTVARMDIWLHLLINLLSTFLLGGSNYCMQCLCAPTRSEINKAHAKGRYLDIGVPSIRNLSFIPNQKKSMWCLLALSSIPLHLMYNSAFYSSLSTNDYDLIWVTPDFLSGGSIGYNYSVDYAGRHITGNENEFNMPATTIQQQLASNDTFKYKRLDTLSCIKAYGKVFEHDYRTCIMVTSNSSNASGAQSSVLWRGSYSFVDHVYPQHQRYYPFDWVCLGVLDIYCQYSSCKGISDFAIDKPCDSYLDRIEANADIWRPVDFDVEYCLAEVAEESCSFNGNIAIIVIVIVCNIIKVLLMLMVALRLKDDPLITIGDAIESFLDLPDRYTKGLCRLTRRDVRQCEYMAIHQQNDGEAALQYDKVSKLREVVTKIEPLRWSNAASGSRWSSTILLLLLAIVAVAGLLIPAVILAQQRGLSVLSLGFGTAQAATVISGWSIERIENSSTQVLAAILVANTPQIILSFLYFSLNGLMTSMWAALEWSKFATQRKYLRVSTPKGKQRSKHFLSLPYKIGIPLLVTSALLHWLISQSFFLVVVASYDNLGNLVNPVQIASCGFSPLAMVIVLVLGTIIIVGTILIGRQHYDPSMPLAGSCSIVISAACHRPEWDGGASLSMVQWGALPMEQLGEEEIGHCCFSSGEVESVQEGRRYAGYSSSVDPGRCK